MAGLTDLAFRMVCRENFRGLTYTEMISVNGIIYGSKNTFDLLKTNLLDRPIAIQLFGHEPEKFSYAIKLIEDNSLCSNAYDFDVININMGCPMKKITSNGDGSALLNDLCLVYKIINQSVKSTKKKVSAKIRKCASKEKTLELVKTIEEAGASEIIIHARTAAQKYSGNVDIDIISEIKAAVSIPVIANGDIKNEIEAESIIKETNCDGVMIGRAAIGNPSLLNRIDNYLKYKELKPVITYKDKITSALKHIDLAELYVLYPSKIKKHLNAYVKGIDNAIRVRNQINSLSTYKDFRLLFSQLQTDFIN
jgi:tRNA-dihydrouridine synthase B